ncbi:MAG TPA: hypothetical protein VK563_00240 [Puia sp.]|nr:hypothetical protein [Puia sp.]
MNLKFITCLFLLCIFFDAKGQKVDADTLITRIKSSISAFMVKHHVLTEDEAKSSPDAVYAMEVIGNKAISYSKNGIYRIGVFQSHSVEHILIKESSQFRIFDIRQIDETLKEVINYSARNKVNVDSMFSYINKIINMYDSNYKRIPNSAGKMPVTKVNR